MTKKTKNKYNHYTEDFRREAVRRSEQEGASSVDVTPAHLLCSSDPLLCHRPGLVHAGC